MSEKLPILLEYAAGGEWAMRLETLQRACEVVERHVSGVKLSAEEITAATAGRAGKIERSYEVTSDGTAIIPVSGVIAKYSRMVNGTSQPRGTSVQLLRTQLREALADRAVGSIMLYVESPGGMIDGLAGLADEIHAARREKPVTAYIDDLGASAAYWLASQASRVYANETADVGSIGIYTIYVDSSERAAQEGLRFVICRSGANKGVGTPGVEITAENAAVIQERIDAKYQIFLAAVMRGRAGRGLAAERLAELADGRTYIAAAAAAEKMIDGVMDFETALAKSAELELDEEDLEEIGTAAAAVETDITVSLNERKEVMSDKEKTAQPDAAALQAEATKAERERIEAISTALPGEQFAELRKQAIAAGWDITRAKAEALPVAQQAHAAELAAVRGELETAKTKLEAIAQGGDDGAAAEASDAGEDSGAAGDGADGAIYARAVERMRAQGMTETQAYRAAARQYPQAHAAWKAGFAH